MINLLIMVLMAMSNGTACTLGTKADYYPWIEAHPDYKVAHEFNLKGYKPVWLMTSETDSDIYLFEFAKQDALNGGKNQHGDCFNDLGAIPVD